MKRCLITCATSEVGQAIALYLVDKYDELIIIGRNSDKLDKIENDLKALSKSTIRCIQLDFLEKQKIYDAVDEIQEDLDAIVMLLPKIPASSTIKVSDKKWEELFRLTFIRPLLLLELLIPGLKKPKRSKVVLMSGITSKQYLGNYSINGPIRAAWIAQMKAMSQEYGQFGIHFNTLSFGGIMTPSFTEKIKREAEDKGLELEAVLMSRYTNVPLKKYASMEDVCHSIEGMLSSMSDHITGQNIICDGGFVRCY